MPVSSCAQGVRIRERELQHIWMSPEAPWVREAVAIGVPLRATLEGPGADRFSLDVTNAAGSNKASGGHSEQRQGKAKGVRASVRTRRFRAGRRGRSAAIDGVVSSARDTRSASQYGSRVLDVSRRVLVPLRTRARTRAII